MEFVSKSPVWVFLLKALIWPFLIAIFVAFTGASLVNLAFLVLVTVLLVLLVYVTLNDRSPVSIEVLQNGLRLKFITGKVETIMDVEKVMISPVFMFFAITRPDGFIKTKTGSKMLNNLSTFDEKLFKEIEQKLKVATQKTN